MACIDDGLSDVSMATIAARAGVAPSSLYRRWGSLPNLVTEALLERSRLSVPVPDTGTVRTDLIAFAEAVAALLSSPRGGAVLRATSALEGNEGLAAARTRFWDERFALASVIVQRGIDRGELDASTDPRVLLELVVAPLHLRRLLLGQDAATTIEQQVDLLLRGAGRTP